MDLVGYFLHFYILSFFLLFNNNKKINIYKKTINNPPNPPKTLSPPYNSGVRSGGLLVDLVNYIKLTHQNN